MKALAILMIMSLLVACGGGPRSHIEKRFGETGHPPPADSYAETVEARVADARYRGQQINRGVAPAAHRGDYPRRHHREHHHHEEPSPEAQQFAEAALIVTGSVFLCTFVVVVLDGACEFGVGFGYHYY